MKKILYTFCLLLLVSWMPATACTNFIVGPDASADGSIIVSYAADSYSLYGFLRYSPAADYPKGAMREVRDWDTGKPLGQIPQVAHTYSVVGNQNEHQLTIGETTWGGRPELEGDQGIDYGSLIYIALERCKTAREAITCMTDLASKYGYASSGESFTLADQNEVWIMDLIGTGKGKNTVVWVATRVPDDMICAHANQARIQQINFRDPKNWLYSKNVISFARKKGYFSGKDADFSFQEAYCPYDFTGLLACEGRVWSFFRHFSDDMDRYYDFASGKTFVESGGKNPGERMPLFIRPNRKVSVQDIKECMRDEYRGTPLDITEGQGAGPWHSKLRYGGLVFQLDSVNYCYPRPTATQQTGWSYVAQIRRGHHAGGIFWFGVDDAACSCYVPIYSRITEIPECFREGNGDLYTYSPTSAWWQFNMVANWAYTKYDRMYPEIRSRQEYWDNRFNALIDSIDYDASFVETQEELVRVLNLSVAQMSDALMKDWRQLEIYLRTKYIDGQERKMENGEFLRNEYGEPKGPNRPAFPEWFLRQIKDEVNHE
ncbi:MAG: C69 family dipeptidase [Paludibacteraceae bacterium]|nr:C69 family dipeptidase [Paludibacteraceae bacterium]